jgi:hypothetical protein
MRNAVLYLLLAAVMTWPMVTAPHATTVGFANIDALDTLSLRGLIAATSPLQAPWTDAVFFPVGYPVLTLTPNILDHLTGALLTLLPFPLSDNLWWLAVLTLNGLCAHRLGARLGGEPGGWLAGVIFLMSEPLAREVNLHHAPQSMAFFAPLYLDALLALREIPSPKRAALAGLWLAGAGWSYWYLAMFLGVASLPLLIGVPLGSLAVLGGVAGLVAAPGLLPWLVLFDDLPLTAMSPPPPAMPDASYAALPDGQAFITQHGSDPLFWLRRTPLDTTSRVSLVALVAAILGGRGLDRRTAVGLWLLCGVGAVMVLGPYLKWGDAVVLVGGEPIPLPFRGLSSLHPFLARLTWPERWGLIVPLGLAALAARAPRPGLLALLVGAEALLVSGNLPTQSISLRHERCWSALSGATGAVLELPQRRPGLRIPRVTVHSRFHGRPVVNPILLPPGVEPPEAWAAWREAQPLIAWLREFESGKWPQEPGAAAVAALRDAGVSVIALDVEPGVMLTEAQLSRYRAGLWRHLGPPIDLGCAWVWWLDTAPPPTALPDGDAWRAESAAWKAAHPDPDLDTLIQPSWDVQVGGVE